MRKLSRMLKRTLASFLAVLMVMTAGNVGLVASVFALDAEHDHEHITLGQILAGNYELSDVEEDVLKSGALSADVTFHYELPPAEADDENKLVTVDKDSKTITVKDFEDGQKNVWVPKSVQLKVNDEVVDTVTLTDGKGTYAYTGNAFAVVVEYVLTGGGLKDGITNVQQLALLNAVLYLAEDVDYMQKLDEDAFASMSTTVGGQVTTVDLTPNSFLAMMTIANPMLDGQTPVDLIYSLIQGYAQSVTLPGENGVDETVTISIKLEGDAAAAANSLNQQQTDAGKLALPAFLEKNSCSYLELLYNDSLRAGLEQALDQNIADISGLLAAEGGLKGVADEIEKIRTETLPALESKVYSMINAVMPDVTAIVGPIAGVEGDVNTLAEVEAVQTAVQSYYDEALATANGMIADKIEEGTLKEEWLPAPEAGETSFDIDNAADLKALIDKIQGIYDDGIAEVNVLLTAYGTQYGINFPEVKFSADMEGVRDAVDAFIAEKIGEMNATITKYNTDYAEYDLNLPTVGYEGLDSIADTAADVKAVQNALDGKATQLDAAYAVLLGQVNAALTGKGYPGTVTSSANLVTVTNAVKASIAAQEQAIKDAIQEANKILEGTGCPVTVDAVDPLGDIDAAVEWLGENTSQNVKDAQAAVEAQLVIARNLAISLGYPAEDAANLKSSDDLDKVATWLDQQIADDEAELESKVEQANDALQLANSQLPAGVDPYTGKIEVETYAEDIDAVIAWMNGSVTTAENTYNAALVELNTKLDNAGYTGADVKSSADIAGVKTWLDTQLANAKTAYNNALAELNTKLDNAGYTGADVESSADIAGVKTWLDTQLANAKTAYNNALAELNTKLDNAGYTGDDVGSSADIAGVKTWLDNQLTTAKGQYTLGVEQLNTELHKLDELGYAGPYVTDSNSIDGVITAVNKLFDDQKAAAQQQIDEKLEELNGLLNNYGYSKKVETSDDIADAVDYMENDAEAHIWAKVNEQIKNNAPFPYNQYTVNSDNAATVQSALNQVGQTALAAGVGAAVTMVNNISTVISALNEAEPALATAEAGLVELETQRAATINALTDAKASLKTAEDKIAETEAALPGLKTQLDEAYDQLVDAETKIAETEAALPGLKAQLDEGYTQLKTAEDKIAETEAALPDLKDQLDDAYDQLVAAEQQIADAKAMVTTYTGYLNSYKAQMAALEEKIEAAKDTLAGKKDQIAAAKADVKAKEDALNALGNPFTAKINDLNAERSKIVDANAQITSDNELIAALNGYKSQLVKLENVKTQLTAANETLDGLYKTLTVDVPAMLTKLDEGEATLQQAEEAIDTLNGYYDMMVTAEDAIDKLGQAVDGLKQLEEYKTLLNTYANYLPTLIGVLEKFLTAVKPVEERFDNDAWNTNKNDEDYVSPIVEGATTAQLTKLTDWADTMLDPDEDGVDVIPELYTEADLKTADELTVDTGMSQYNMSMFNVSFTYKAWIVNEATGELEEHVLYGPTVTLEAGADRDTILQAIDDAIDLPGALSPAEAAEQWGIAEEMYGYNGTFNDVPDTLEDDFTYVLTITPKELNVHWTVEAPYSATVYFGQKVTLPVCAEEGKEYTYDVNGSKYYQGQIVRITEETYITQFKGDMSAESNMLDLVVNATGVKENALIKNILSSNAVVYGETVRIRFPSNSLLSVSGNFLTALPYENAIGDKSWVAQSAVSKDMDGNELQTSAVINNVALFDQDIAVADVLYQIAFTAADLSVEEDAILAAMNLANVLADEYADQKEALDFLSSDSFMNALAMLDWNDSDIQGYLSTAATVLTGSAASALKVITNDLASTTNGKLTLYNYLFNYKAQGMSYYYQNDAAIRTEIQKMQNAMQTLTSDSDFMGLVQQNSADLHDKLVSIKDSLLAVTVPAKNSHIVVSNNDALKQLVSDLDAYAKTAKMNYTEVGTMTWSTTLTATAGVKIATVTVNWGTKSGELKVNFEENAVLDQNDIDTLMSKLEALEAEMGIDTVHYERTGTLPQVGEVMSEDRSYSVSWQAKTYDVYAGGELIGSVTYGDPYIELPAHTDSEWRYDYTVGTGDDAVKYVQGETLYFDDPKTTDVNEFDQWFDANGDMLKTIQRTEVDKIREQLITFVDRMNGAAILVEKGNRDYSIVLQLDPATISNDMSMFVMGLLMSGYGYIGMDNQMFYGKMDEANEDETAQFHLQAMVDMIMNSGLGTDSIIALYDANGNFVNLSLSGNVISNKGGDMKALGGTLLQSTMSFGTTSADDLAVNFYITMPDSATLAGAADKLASVKDNVSLALRNGRLEAVLNLPEPVYAAYLSALLVLGETDLRSIDEINAEIAIGYLFDQLDPILGEKDVTTETFENTAGMFGVDVDLSEYASTYEYIKKLYASLEAHRTYGDKFCEFTYEDVSINSLIDWAQANVVGQLAASFGVEPDAIQLSNLIYEYKPANADENRGGYGLDMKLYTELTNLGVDYAAMFIDLQGDGVANKIGLLSEQEIANGALANMTGPAMVILLADVNANVVLNGYTVLDLNGKTINGSLTANAATIITDNAYTPVDSVPGGVTGSVSGAAHIIGGKYTANVSSFLDEGYEQVDGVVSNKLFSVTTDTFNNITVTLNASKDALADQFSVAGAAEIALEILSSLVLNNYAVSGMHVQVDGQYEKLYSMGVEDVVTLIAGENRLNTLINTGLDWVNESTMADLFNMIVNDLINFEEMQTELAGDGVVAQYGIMTAPWDLELYRTEGDYLTFDLATSDDADKQKISNLTIVIADGKDRLADLADALAGVLELKLTVDLDDVALNAASNVGLAGVVDTSITIDLREQPAAFIMMAVILADGMEDGSEIKDLLVKGIDGYYENGEMCALEKAFTTATVKQLCDALRNHSRAAVFSDMVDGLGLDHASDVKATISNNEKRCEKIIDAVGVALRQLESRTLVDRVTNSGRIPDRIKNHRVYIAGVDALNAVLDKVDELTANNSALKGIEKTDENGDLYYGGAVDGFFNRTYDDVAGSYGVYADLGAYASAKLYLFNESEHVFDQKVEDEKYLVSEATCTEKGTYYYSCICGEKGTETFEVDELGHSFTNYVSNDDAACTEDGTKTAQCDRGCGETDTVTDEGTALGHVEKLVNKVEATCTQEGYTGDTVCERCGDVLAVGVVVPVTDHVDESPADHVCDICGTTVSKCVDENADDICDICGKDLDDSCVHVDTNPADHKCDNCGEIVSECKDENPADHKCDTCGDTVSDCSYGQQWESDEDGHWQVCTVCGQPGQKSDHQYSGWTLKEAATCCSEGSEARTCLICKYEDTRATAKDPDNHAGGTEIRDAVKATCQSAGYTGDTYCLGCGNKIADGKATDKDPSNHIYSDEWTYDETGHWHANSCPCTNVAPKDFAAHNYEVTGSKEPSGNDEGYTEYTCTECEHSYKGEYKKLVTDEFVEDHISDELKQMEDYDTVDEIIEATKEEIEAEANITLDADKTVLYDVTLKYQDENGVWQNATKDHFPVDGKLTVSLPVPGELDASKYTFYVAHMHAMTAFGKNAGEIETIQVEPQNGAVTFEVTGLSPMLLGWHCSTNHADTEVQGYKDATCTQEGYTGDTVCKNCGEVLEEGTVKSKLAHVDANKDHACDYGCSEVVGDHTDANKDHECDYGCSETIGVCEDADKDHKCDHGCDKVYGEHKDADKDHACDYGCSEKIGEHTDAGKDHACDYGCKDAIGTCEDADKDHDCDYGCEKVYGTCEDTDKDHACDYGCGKIYGAHVDTDKNHVCDYGCSVAMGICADTDKDHACDYGCDKVYGTCEDADKDHDCDYGCGKTYGTHEDTNKDHVCDYGCDEAIGTHGDTNKDHVCDYGCTEKIGTCEDADKDHACDYGCEKVYGEHKDTNKDHACDYGCTESIGDHTDADKNHICDYGCDQGIGACEDTDKDHACDYGCGKDYGTCGDADKDHACDYGCDKVYGTHEDTNKDHSCDYGCDETIGTCEDADKDHDCDYGCDKVFGTCEDTDKDHACDYGCKKVYGEHKDIDKDHDCDYGCDEAIGDHTDADKDHDCDYGCSESIGTCEDADKDHTCDHGCGKGFGKHEDLNSDHACDYGCKDAIGTCADADKDHDCDYGCDKVYGTHGDADKDHACDYGCFVTIGKHEDTNTDHICDYGCSESIGTCEDADKDHDCDYGCDKVYGTCGDADKDHACDYGCVKVYGEHVDANKDHDCDYGCDQTIGAHSDADKDHDCDYGCDQTIGTHEDANNDHVCDYGCSDAVGEHVDANKDHVCDNGCSNPVGKCEDADKDHECDYGCGKDYGTHADNNKDHVCDYGCDEAIGTHGDTNKDHACDYGCTEKIGTCEDADKDHECDYGCGKDYGTHADADKDHKCDYGCSESFGTHEDANGDHMCDYGCSNAVGEHVDANKDHVCDNGCGNPVGKHEDLNKDHTCDYGCTEKIGTCEDADKDHECDYGCGKDYGTCEDADKDHDCDYGCEKIYGTHADTNQDHACDYGCTVTIGKCEDKDKDHDCDYGCSEFYGKHEDLNKDHNCDYGCLVPIGKCEDADLDHKCDHGCGKDFGKHQDLDKNHACDYGCTEKIGTCADADKDHDCDYGCDKVYGTHADADKDHDCDYGCSEAIGTHADADKDHDCDYGCSEKIGTCADADKDHDCDYGCSKVHGTHADADKDHACDYGCTEKIGTCADADKDHDCDYGCDKVHGTHADADKDHACDYGCAETIGKCEDTDKDHDCDYGCDKVYGTHADANKDHACDYGCTEKIGTCADADKDHDCDYGCDKVHGTHADANKDHKCDYGCVETIGKCEDNDADGKCDYGCGKNFILPPEVGVPELPVGDAVLGFMADEDEGILFLDTINDGMSIEKFVELLQVAMKNDADNICDITIVGEVNGLIATGTQVTVTAKNKLGVDSATYDIVVMGDTNRDGKVSSGDASLIYQHFCGTLKKALNELQLLAGDTNGNGRLESGDANKIYAKYVGSGYTTILK